MSKDKSPRAPKKEHSALQKANQEIKMLKRQLSRLKKIIAHMNLEEYSNIQEAQVAQQREYKQLKQNNTVIEEMGRWKCFNCDKDYLRLIIYQRIDVPYYFRRCPTCGKKTKSQKFNDTVKGINSNDELVDINKP